MATDCLFKITKELKDPIIRGDDYIYHIHLPCGKCGRCIERRKMEWGFRMSEEMRVSKVAYFVTLTYSPNYVPYTDKGRYTLIDTRKRDLENRLLETGRKRITKKFKRENIDRSLQGFFKRLRINQKRSVFTYEHLFHNLNNNDKVSFYGCGEYGSERGRPHYHAIIFNVSRKVIEASWNLGDVHIVPATEGRIMYCMKYLDKRYYSNDNYMYGSLPEFNTMSEGIGKSYIDRLGKWHRNNIDILFVTSMKGIMCPMPNYYRRRIFSDQDREDQVLIVEGKLMELKEDKIKKLGYDEFCKQQADLKKESQKRFKKKIQKRRVD